MRVTREFTPLGSPGGYPSGHFWLVLGRPILGTPREDRTEVTSMTQAPMRCGGLA